MGKKKARRKDLIIKLEHCGIVKVIEDDRLLYKGNDIDVVFEKFQIFPEKKARRKLDDEVVDIVFGDMS